MTAAGVLVAVLLFGASACDDGSSIGGEKARDCGLLTPEPEADASLLPPGFVPEGAEVVKVKKSKERITAALNNLSSVADSFDFYREAAKDAGFDLVGTDNEGFEAEVYIRKGKELGAIQIRTSTCDDASVVFVNIVQT